MHKKKNTFSTHKNGVLENIYFLQRSFGAKSWKRLSHGWNNRMENQDSWKLQIQEKDHMFQEKCES